MESYLTANYHTHTTRCHHAVGEDRAYVEAAIEAGIRVLGFSDHIPMPEIDERLSGIRMSYAQVEDYLDSLHRLQQEYKQEITIYIGYEGEYFAPLFEEQMRRLRSFGYDYLILGQHFVITDGRGVYTGAPTDSVAILKMYVDWCIEGLSTGAYRYLCHPDLIYFTGDETVWRREMTRLCRYCKEHRIPMEYNLLGAMEGRQYPSERFLALAGEMENDIIIGIDAHDPGQIGNQSVYQMAQSAVRKYQLHVQTDLPGLR